MNAKLAAYLRRIRYGGPLDRSLRTLRGLHQAHLLGVSYENLDVQLGEQVTLDSSAVFEKIVERKRGGWCYEMNGLFAWALRELGFDISLVAGAAGRKERGAGAEMNHLAILVHLDKTYLADVGFGNGFIAPLALEEGTHTDGRFPFALNRLDAQWWRFTNRPQSPDTFDFRETPYEMRAFSEKNAALQSDPESYFVQNLVCHRFTQEGVVTLRGAMLTTFTPSEIREQTVRSRDELAAILRTTFELETPHIDVLWERVAARHAQWLKRIPPRATSHP